MSGTQVSSFGDPNLLLQTLSGAQTANVQRNQLLNQTSQQAIGQNEAEMMARAAAGLLSLPTEEARAAAYPQARQQLLDLNFGQKSPETYPGEATLRRVALMGTPSSKQAEWNYNTGVNQVGLGPPPAAPGTTATTPAPVTGTGTGAVAAQPVEPDALTRAQAVRDGLVKRGLDPDTATAFAANALHESSARPDTGPGDRGASHGIFQWQGPRYDAYKSIWGNVPDNAPLDQQLDYVMHELNTTESAARDKIAAAKTPEEKAAAISEFYLRPKDVGPEKERRSATARQLVSQWGGSGQPATTYVGDSLVEPGGVGGQTGQGVRGANPDAVLARLRDPNATSDTQIRGKNIVLSSGASNNPEHAQLLALQLQTLQDRGAGNVTVLGVGPGVKGADVVNAQLKEIAERNGARFVALPADQMGKDGIHPTKEGYAALQAQVRAAPAAAATGGDQPPAPYKVAGAVVPPSTGVPGAPVTPPNALAPGAPGVPATATVQPAPQNRVAPAVAQPQTQPPTRPPALGADNLTDDDRRQLAGMVRGDPGEFTRTRAAMQARNIAQQHQAFEERSQVAAQAAAQAERDYQHGRNTQADVFAAQKDAREAAAAALSQKTQGVPTGYQRNASGAIEPIPGYRGATGEERLDYDLKHADHSSQDYADAWAAKKWKVSPNGTVIENDMSGWAAPTRNVQRPTYLPAPTPQMLDEVRKVDTDARVIVPAIDRYVDLHKAIGGGSWGAYFDDPRSPKAQQLIGAFNAMKTVLRSPAYANTGVLQPAEMEMLKQELVSPQTIRGLYATPQALEARLHEIKLAILSRQDAERRSVGQDGVIVRDKADFAKVPIGGQYYDEEGNRWMRKD